MAKILIGLCFFRMLEKDRLMRISSRRLLIELEDLLEEWEQLEFNKTWLILMKWFLAAKELKYYQILLTNLKETFFIFVYLF